MRQSYVRIAFSVRDPNSSLIQQQIIFVTAESHGLETLEDRLVVQNILALRFGRFRDFRWYLPLCP